VAAKEMASVFDAMLAAAETVAMAAETVVAAMAVTTLP
jgi:hypothetical protein